MYIYFLGVSTSSYFKLISSLEPRAVCRDNINNLTGGLIMATYKEIQEYIRNEKGYVAQTCWIAHTKVLCGIQTRTAPNRIDSDARVKPCPADKVEDIKEAFRHFGMI